MANGSTSTPVSAHSKGRGLLWGGIVLCVLAIGLVAAQYSLRQLVVPWYWPILTTVGALLLAWSLTARFTAVRAIVLGLVTILAALQWLFLGVYARLPEYTGPAELGKPIPAFQTMLANGRPFTQRDLQ